MKPNFLPLLFAGLFILRTPVAGAETEIELIAILQSDTSIVQKCDACQKLRLIGTAKAVPALAALLNQERVSQAARFALEGLRAPEGSAALREAIGKTSGFFKAGVVDSLGWLHDASALPLLTPLLTDPDATIASAAAAALGRIDANGALTALQAARESASAAVRPAVLEALMRCAEKRLADGKVADAKPIYESLAKSSEADGIRVAAFEGLMRCSGRGALAWIKSALQGADPAAQIAALQLAGGIQDPQATRVFAGLLPKSKPALQVALLGLLRTRGDAAALSAVQTAAQSNDSAVRIAALTALGELGDANTVATLAEGASSRDAAEQKTARQALASLHRGDIAGAIVTQLSSATPAVQMELIRALAARDEQSAVSPLLQLARKDQPATRKAALQALGSLANGNHIAALVKLLADARDPDARAEIVSVFESMAERLAGGKGLDVEPIAQGLRSGDLETRKSLLQVSVLFVSEPLRSALRSALRDSNEGVRTAAARALCGAHDVALLPDLVSVARETSDSGLRSLAIGGIARLATDEAPELSVPQRTEALATAFDLASRVEDKRQVLSGLARVPNRTTLELAQKASADPAVRAEAGAALLQITQKLGFSGPFIQDWLVCGPYRKAGVAGALAVFNVPFGPENPGEKVQWHSIPRADGVNLGAVFPGEENCAAYLKTEVIAPEAGDGILLLGSDDGVKAWLNGKVVHANNVDRGDVADQDKVPIRFVKGSNELMLKITQGGGGWSVHARIVGQDGQPIQGLRIAGQTSGPSASAQPSKSP